MDRTCIVNPLCMQSHLISWRGLSFCDMSLNNIQTDRELVIDIDRLTMSGSLLFNEQTLYV